jgi:hypothetical protein
VYKAIRCVDEGLKKRKKETKEKKSIIGLVQTMRKHCPTSPPICKCSSRGRRKDFCPTQKIRLKRIEYPQSALGGENTCK